MPIIFLDTEFTDFKTQDLISIALYNSDTGEFLYREVKYNSNICSAFVLQTVIPLLTGPVVTYEQAAQDVIDWINSQGEDVTVVCDYIGDITLLYMLMRSSTSQCTQPKFAFEGQMLYSILDALKRYSWAEQEEIRSEFDQLKEQFLTANPRRHNALEDVKDAARAWNIIIEKYCK